MRTPTKTGQIGILPTADERKSLNRWFFRSEISYRKLAEFYSPESLGRYLDYGCGNLTLAHNMAGRATEGYGVDITEPKQEPPTGFRFTRVSVSGPLPFPEVYFDTVFLIEVIEHVPSERRVLEEVARVMKCGATLIITTPHRGLLTWVDVGNWKYCMPRVHRWIHVVLFHNRVGYDARFGEGRPEGLFGDITGNRHNHYSLQEFLRLVPSGLRLRRARVSYPAMRLIGIIEIAIGLLPMPRVWDRLFCLSPMRRFLSRRSLRRPSKKAQRFSGATKPGCARMTCVAAAMRRRERLPWCLRMPIGQS